MNAWHTFKGDTPIPNNAIICVCLSTNIPVIYAEVNSFNMTNEKKLRR